MGPTQAREAVAAFTVRAAPACMAAEQGPLLSDCLARVATHLRPSLPQAARLCIYIGHDSPVGDDGHTLALALIRLAQGAATTLSACRGGGVMLRTAMRDERSVVMMELEWGEGWHPAPAEDRWWRVRLQLPQAHRIAQQVGAAVDCSETSSTRLAVRVQLRR